MGIPRFSDLCRLRWRSRTNSYPAAVTERASVVEPQRWGDDPTLVELLGEQGAAGVRALFDGFPEAVRVLWALRDTEGRIVDFSFGYGNPSILRAFRLPPGTRDRYTLLQALPRMRGSRLRFLRSGVRDRRSSYPGGDLRHAARRRATGSAVSARPSGPNSSSTTSRGSFAK